MMRVNVVEKDVMNPLAEAAVGEISIAPFPKRISKIAYFDNTKPNANLILQTIKESLDIDHVNAIKPAGAPATEEQMIEAKKGDVVILAVGDCGSCTTWIIRDAVNLEKDGVPSICICSHKFSEYAHSLAKAQGIENMRILEIEHPISGIGFDEVKLKTWKIIPDLKKLLEIN